MYRQTIYVIEVVASPRAPASVLPGEGADARELQLKLRLQRWKTPVVRYKVVCYATLNKEVDKRRRRQVVWEAVLLFIHEFRTCKYPKFRTAYQKFNFR